MSVSSSLSIHVTIPLSVLQYVTQYHRQHIGSCFMLPYLYESFSPSLFIFWSLWIQNEAATVFYVTYLSLSFIPGKDCDSSNEHLTKSCKNEGALSHSYCFQQNVLHHIAYFFCREPNYKLLSFKKFIPPGRVTDFNVLI